MNVAVSEHRTLSRVGWSRANRVLSLLERSHLRLCGVLVLLCFVCFLPGFRSRSSRWTGTSRAIAQASKQMLESGDFVDIRFQDEARHKKPVGIYWLQSASVAVGEALGVPEARTTIALYRHPLAFRRDRDGAADLLGGARLHGAPGRIPRGRPDGTSHPAHGRSTARQDRRGACRLQRRRPWGRWRAPISAGAAGCCRGGRLACFWLAARRRHPRSRARWSRCSSGSRRWRCRGGNARPVGSLALRPGSSGLIFSPRSSCPGSSPSRSRAAASSLRPRSARTCSARSASAQELHWAPPGYYLVAFFAHLLARRDPCRASRLPSPGSHRRDDTVAFSLAWIVPCLDHLRGRCRRSCRITCCPSIRRSRS